MKTSLGYRRVPRGGESSIPQAPVLANGFSIVELVVVVAIILIVLAIVAPQIRQAVPLIRARGSAGELAGLMQNARILAAKNNQIYQIQYTTIGADQAAFIDLSVGQTGVYAQGDPLVVFNRGVTPAAGAPSGGSGQPPAFVLTGDTSSGTPYDNATTLAFNQRGLPCQYVPNGTPTCPTPAPTYFVYYLNSGTTWSAVVVTKGGRTRVIIWNGATWEN